MQSWHRIVIWSGLVCFQPVYAQQPGVGFSMIGIGPGETARINALNQFMGPRAVSSEQGLPPATCAMALRFFDTDGKLLKERVESVDPGKASFLDLDRSELSGGDTRVPVRAVLNFGYWGGANPSAGILRSSRCDIVASLEVFDSDTKKTRVVITDVKPLPGPPEPLQ